MSHLYRSVLYCLLVYFSGNAFSWNALGHRLIAQIAYDQLTPQAKRIVNRYNRAAGKVYGPLSFVNAAVWLDWIRYQKNDSYNVLHYINLYFSEDGTPIPRTPLVNAVSGIEQSIGTLSQANSSDFQKGVALRVLLHVVGDIHQPMHATSRVSQRYPDGDRGGHYVGLAKNPIAKNLHGYWDNGAGYLARHRTHKRKQSIKKMAAQLEKEYPCNTVSMTVNPSLWANESHELGVDAYRRLFHTIPHAYYQYKSMNIVKKRIALAGCRLGFLLNSHAFRS
jgi:hypothetical protein